MVATQLIHVLAQENHQFVTIAYFDIRDNIVVRPIPHYFPGKKWEMSIFANFWLLHLSNLREMKFCVNERYNGKAGRVLNNQQLKISYPSEEKRVFKLCFQIFSIVSKWTFHHLLSSADHSFFNTYFIISEISSSSSSSSSMADP